MPPDKSERVRGITEVDRLAYVVEGLDLLILDFPEGEVAEWHDSRTNRLSAVFPPVTHRVPCLHRLRRVVTEKEFIKKTLIQFTPEDGVGDGRDLVLRLELGELLDPDESEWIVGRLE